MDQLFHDWYRTDLSRRLKYPEIPYRVYTKDISPINGIKCIAEVTARDVREVLERIRERNRLTIANDTLMYMKQLFRHAIKLDLTLNNPAAAFTVDDAGGVESSKDRILSKEEIHYAFSVFHTHINSFGRDNYLACCLFLVLGVRKSKLCEAMWREMDLTTGVSDLPKERSKLACRSASPYHAKPLLGLTNCKSALVARLMFSRPDEQAIVRIWGQIRLTAQFLNSLVENQAVKSNHPIKWVNSNTSPYTIYAAPFAALPPL